MYFEEFLRFRGQDIDRYKAIQRKQTVSIVDYEIYDMLYDAFIHDGGFPEVVLAPEKEKMELLEDIFSSYFQKEVIALGDWRKNDAVRDLIVLLAARVGSRLDLVRLSQELGVSRPTLYNYLSFLQATYFIHLIPQFSRSADRQVSGTKKIYFCDNGILQTVGEHIDAGTLLENTVYNQLRHYGNIAYYRSGRGNEIDFIVGNKTGYEVKRTATKSDTARLSRMLQDIRIKEGKVISLRFVENQEQVRFAEFL